MTEPATTEAVRNSVTVPLSEEDAFELFVDRFSEWWPLSTHHIGVRPAVQAIIEPHSGGRWFERDDAGAECEWGSVLAVEPPGRILLAWQLSPTFEYDPRPRSGHRGRGHLPGPGRGGHAGHGRAPRLRGSRRGRRLDARFGGGRGRLVPAARVLCGVGTRVTSLRGERVTLEAIRPEHVERLRGSGAMRCARSSGTCSSCEATIASRSAPRSRTRGRSAYEKVGFRRVGALRKAALSHLSGEWEDELLMELVV